ncbi:hypothetical protein A3F07_03515 [candidate division WWE3 bacterium RIFCSPHIGHO2_12_FULL_38_15]|uniref:Uncharacterized protein n=1 Tax=candidate division WWE3 bacterium RIFCSPHIGHO2_02_FULL_38_14 TaxID=1802620 RepID=A0A1F4V8N4_UNCKA|nr:MAG: hypothetical protein A2793_02865 [candidate division WWE3 bacterium RIFCSPHIGHO2_01_FULL_38_45]OGC48866.1 MAG: hypothetical protein A3F07_03515 [candidate division WWE3 bacterium RIFCSPHIGHO2_12_FULL_38_15]OGC53013.1 MAG: hypothetical protein A3D91_01745 [candidate division WWE3 bacterium RIFCSPHIGHO2_02_FULL_38_14]OGC53169.1 MAG: hypothetical protein A3B64_01855 [candidate division WWE3 bacterium RIFCSPLOWO2_01_FULL_37_24]HLB52014.1 hypothetical protein [Patescibacteria group bacterium
MKKMVFLTLFILISVASVVLGYKYGSQRSLYVARKNPADIEIINKEVSRSGQDFSLFWDVWDKLVSRYLERPVDQQKMLEGAISGVEKSLESTESAANSL